MKFAALFLLSALMLIACDREGYKNSNYSKPLNEETLRSTNGLDPRARIDTVEARPPSETPGVKGSSGEIRIQNPENAVGTNAAPAKGEN